MTKTEFTRRTKPSLLQIREAAAELRRMMGRSDANAFMGKFRTLNIAKTLARGKLMMAQAEAVGALTAPLHLNV